MRTSDFIGLVGGDRKAETEYACCPGGGSVTILEDGVMRDESGHEISMTHVGYVLRMQTAITAILDLHRPDHEGIVSRCVHDGRVWPCPTREAVNW